MIKLNLSFDKATKKFCYEAHASTKSWFGYGKTEETALKALITALTKDIARYERRLDRLAAAWEEGSMYE